MIDLSLNVDEVLPAVEACEDRDALEAALSAARRVTVRRAIKDRLASLPTDVEAPELSAPEPGAEAEVDEDAAILLARARAEAWRTIKAQMVHLQGLCAAVDCPAPKAGADPEHYRRLAAICSEAADVAEEIAAHLMTAEG